MVGAAGGNGIRDGGGEQTPKAGKKPVVPKMDKSTDGSESEERDSVKEEEDSEEDDMEDSQESESGKPPERRKSSLSVRKFRWGARTARQFLKYSYETLGFPYFLL